MVIAVTHASDVMTKIVCCHMHFVPMDVVIAQVAVDSRRSVAFFVLVTNLLSQISSFTNVVTVAMILLLTKTWNNAYVLVEIMRKFSARWLRFYVYTLLCTVTKIFILYFIYLFIYLLFFDTLLHIKL